MVKNRSSIKGYIIVKVLHVSPPKSGPSPHSKNVMPQQRRVLKKICDNHFEPLEMRKKKSVKNDCILHTKEQFLIMHHKITREKEFAVTLCCLFITGFPTDDVSMILPFSKVPASPLVP